MTPFVHKPVEDHEVIEYTDHLEALNLVRTLSVYSKPYTYYVVMDAPRHGNYRVGIFLRTPKSSREFQRYVIGKDIR